ncbi:EF-hand domain-containing protein [Sphingomonas sp. PR090111-T3T-6A]|uniref:EF-hand domain-containing protein n=1 Tax=Sphingomonas sp. PR090111-T3T-6A TaxID=685778 RepID=UPI00037AFB6C|nr:EF-hand domain-containing protein [Sphingomonas sp. PR090111-T3T-6A]
MICVAGVALADPPPVKRTDVVARAATMFDRADTNHDGILTREEYHAALAAIAKAKSATPTEKGWAMVDAQFDAVDQSHTGRIPRDVFIAAATAHFDGADLNRDGIVTPDEARKAAKIKRKALKAARPR